MSGNAEPPTKKPYAAPTLTEYGKVASLTLGSALTGSDAGPGNPKNKKPKTAGLGM